MPIRSDASSRPVFDAHADSLLFALDLGRDLGVRGPGQLDLIKAAEGGVGAQVFVCWCDPRFIAEEGGAFGRTDALLARFHALCRQHPDKIAWAGNGVDLAAAQRKGLLAGIPGIEGGHSIEGELDKLHYFFERGVRVMTLVWNNHLDWIRSCQDGAGPGIPEGLGAFGGQVIAEMNELGMVVDLSHASTKAFYQALERSSRPTIASHSGCMALQSHPRNLDDDQLRALAAHGGVVGIAFCTAFLDGAAERADSELRQSPAYRAIRDQNEALRFQRQADFLQRAAPPIPIEVVVDHIVHAVEVAGVEHVGMGSDFDGIQRRPQGLEDACGFVALKAALRQRGLGAEEIEAVLGGNMKRVFAEVTGAGTAASAATLVPMD